MKKTEISKDEDLESVGYPLTEETKKMNNFDSKSGKAINKPEDAVESEKEHGQGF